MYRHFKNPVTGDIYEILHEATSADNLGLLVVYKSMNTGKIWVRSKSEFFSDVNPGQPRFMLIPITNNFDFQYLKLVNHILLNGRDKNDRTGTGTRSITSHSFNIDVSTHFPLLTVKKTNHETILKELIWFLNGSTCTSNSGTSIWTANSSKEFLQSRGLDYKKGYIGPAYGYQWRGKTSVEDELQWCNESKQYLTAAKPGVDQINYIINEIKNNPDSRRILMSNWDVANIKNMALPPCHVLFQIVVRDEYLDGIMYQRSADLFLGVPFNVASYAALLYIIAKVTNKKPGILTIHFGDVHIYSNHISQARLLNQLQVYNSPTLELSETIDINNLSLNDFNIVGYKSGPFIKAEMAV